MNRSYKRPDDSPSFSSSLLEKVFRSMDEGDDDEPVYSAAARKAGSISLNGLEIHRSIIEKRTKKKKVGTNGRNFETEIAAAKLERPSSTALRTDCNDSGFKISICRSYEDSELRAQTPSLIGARNLKPIRTSTTAASRPEQLQTQSCVSSRNKANESHRRREGSRNSSMPKPEAPSPPSSSFQNGKCRAAKMYGDLKPISPGGKLTRFITSLFSKKNSTNKCCEKVRGETTCSSASSYYRSCLRNDDRRTAASSSSSSYSKSTCPAVNIVIDGRQQQRRCNPGLVTTVKSLSHQKCGDQNCRSQLQQVQREEYNNNNNTNGVLNNIHDKLDDDDGGSCASSDLFELEHIGGNGNGTIHDDDELPVYESTHSFTARRILLV